MPSSSQLLRQTGESFLTVIKQMDWKTEPLLQGDLEKRGRLWIFDIYDPWVAFFSSSTVVRIWTLLSCSDFPFHWFPNDPCSARASHSSPNRFDCETLSRLAATLSNCTSCLHPAPPLCTWNVNMGKVWFYTPAFRLPHLQFRGCIALRKLLIVECVVRLVTVITDSAHLGWNNTACRLLFQIFLCVSTCSRVKLHYLF